MRAVKGNCMLHCYNYLCRRIHANYLFIVGTTLDFTDNYGQKILLKIFHKNHFMIEIGTYIFSPLTIFNKNYCQMRGKVSESLSRVPGRTALILIRAIKRNFEDDFATLGFLKSLN